MFVSNQRFLESLFLWGYYNFLFGGFFNFLELDYRRGGSRKKEDNEIRLKVQKNCFAKNFKKQKQHNIL